MFPTGVHKKISNYSLLLRRIIAILYLYHCAFSEIKLFWGCADIQIETVTGRRMRMGVIDTEGKQYLSNTKYFADLFNFLLYDGKPVIKANELQELDTTELTVPYGNHAR